MTCFFINGKSLKHYCKENGISYERTYYWLDKRGMSVDEAINIVKKGLKTNLKWKVNGESLNIYCKKNNILYNTVERLILKGMSIDKAIKRSKKFRNKRGRAVKYIKNGKSFVSICKDLSINYQTAYYWLKKGYDVEYVIRRFCYV